MDFFVYGILIFFYKVVKKPTLIKNAITYVKSKGLIIPRAVTYYVKAYIDEKCCTVVCCRNTVTMQHVTVCNIERKDSNTLPLYDSVPTSF